MPRIDPLQLLTCLKVLLDKNGGILSLNEVKRIAGLMTKYSKKLVSKCIYIQILKCTKTDLLGEFMGAGGWQLVNLWLTDGLRAMNYPLVTEILELFLLCPVDVERLKSNTSPKLVKQLSREGPPDVRILATRLVEQWLNIVKASNLATNNHSSAQNIENNISENKHLKDCDLKREIEVNTTEKIENIVEPKNFTNKSNENVVKSFTSPKRKVSTESTNNLTLKIVVKDGKQIVSKISDEKKNDAVDENDKERKETDNNLDISFKSNESSDKVTDKENVSQKVKEEENHEIKENREGKDKDTNKDKNKDKGKTSINNISCSSDGKDKQRHKSGNSSSKSSSKIHSSSSKSSSSLTKSKHSNKSRNRDKKDSENEKEHKHKSTSKSSSKDKYKYEKDKTTPRDKDREKEKANQAEKDKETLNKVMSPCLDKLGKIPKKPKDLNDQEVVNKPTSITIPSKKASMSIEIRKDSEKAKTVKTYKSQFRSHGLTEEAPPPPSRKQLKKPTNTTPILVPSGGILGSSSFTTSLKRASPTSNIINSNCTSSPLSISNNSSSNCVPSEKKSKIDMIGVSSNIVEKPGSIKLIAPKPKPSLVESDMFMDALSAAAYNKKQTVTKRKRRPSNSTNSESSVSHKAEPLKFYQDTLEVKEEDKLENKTELSSEIENNKETLHKTEDQEDDDDIPLKKVKEDIDQKSITESIKENDENISEEKVEDLDNNGEPKSPEEDFPLKKLPGPGCGPNGPPGVLVLHRRTGPKKKLKWRVQEELEEIRYFELDENERVNVTKAFTDMKNMERMHERETFFLARKLNNEDLMVEQTQWRSLIMVDDVPVHPEGCKSKEKHAQAEREKTTLKALYFSHAMIPDSPSEPDMEQYLITEPKIIPLDDITGNNTSDTVNDFVSYGYPDPKGSPPLDLQDDPMDGMLNLDSISGTEIPFSNQNNQFNPFLPFGGQPIVTNNVNNQNNWVAGLQSGINNIGTGGLLQPNNINNMNNINSINLLRANIGGPINVPLNGPPPLMATAPLGPINNTPFNMPHNILPFGPNGPLPNGMMNGPPQSLLGSIFGPNGIQQQRMNMMHNQVSGTNRNNLNSGNGGNWRSSGPQNNCVGGNWRSNNNERNSRGNDRSNWVHGNANRSVCKQFLRGFCRNGNKCNFLHPGNGQRI